MWHRPRLAVAQVANADNRSFGTRSHALSPKPLAIIYKIVHSVMALRRSIEICANPGSTAGPAFFRDPVPSDETLIAELQPSAAPELFCHRHQTDQLMVLRGSIELVVLQNRRLHRITLREDEPTWVRIPPGVPHGAINRGPTLALVVNAVLRHRPSDGRDYLSRPVPAALASAWADLQDDRVRQDLADWS